MLSQLVSYFCRSWYEIPWCNTKLVSTPLSLIQVDIGFHPPIPLAQKQLFQFGSFSMIFRVLNFRGHFEALNNFFWLCSGPKVYRLGLFHYCTPRWDLSNGLSSNPNGDHMQKLCPQEVGIPTYHFGARKIVGISSSRVMFRFISLNSFC